MMEVYGEKNTMEEVQGTQQESVENQEVTEEDDYLDSEQMESMETMDMERMMEEYEAQEVHRGKKLEGIIVAANDDGWLVDVGYKCEGFLPKREWTHRVLVEDVEEPSVGDTIRVQVVNVTQNEDSQLTVSRWRSAFDERWNAVEEALAEDAPISVKGLRKVKGGLIINCCGIEGFVPVSHLAEEGRGVNPGKFVDETLDVKLLDKDRRKRRLVFSRRNVLEEEMQEERGTFYEDVSEGDVLSGVVTSLTSFGVFVSLGPVEGLVHLSELSWKRNAKPKDLVKKGDEVKVKVIGMDKEENRISLSMKQTMADPWESVAERWNSGDRVEGTVTNLTDFGAFVEIEPGVEGLVHIGDLSWTRIKHPKEVLRKGDTVEVQVLEVDGDRRRISLGYKQLHDPWNGVEERYQAGQDLEVKAVRLAEFGVFVELEKGVEGLIHISQLSRERVEKPEDVIAEGAEVTARILEVNPKERRIRLSLSALQEPLADEPAQRDEDGGRPERSSSSRNRDGGNRDNRRSRGGRGSSGRGSAPSFPQEETAVTLGDVWGDLVNQKIEDQE